MSQLDDVNRFIELSRSVDDLGALHRLIDDITREMGFDHFALIHHVDLGPLARNLKIIDDQSQVALTTYPESWVEEYVTTNMVANDPILIASEKTMVGFRWSDSPKLVPWTSDFRDITDRTRKAGLVGGYTLPAHVPGETNGSCNFAIRAGRELPEDSLLMAQMIGAFAFQSARTLMVAQHKSVVETIEQDVSLTHRQLECLVLVARGKSDWEIGRILGISQETVKAHISAARDAYNVPKRVQVVLRAIHNGHIDLKDVLQ